MDEQSIRWAVKFAMDRQPRFRVEPDGSTTRSLYDRRAQLLKGSQEHHDQMVRFYQDEAVRAAGELGRENDAEEAKAAE